jgi:hypothetical protein
MNKRTSVRSIRLLASRSFFVFHLIVIFIFSGCKKVQHQPDKNQFKNETIVKQVNNNVVCGEYTYWGYVYKEVPDGVDANGLPKTKWALVWDQIQATYCYEIEQPVGGGPSNPPDPPSSTPGNNDSVLYNVSGSTISNLSTYIGCFNPNSDATVTIYVNQPSPGTSVLYSASPYYIGEAFVQIRQGSVAKVFGFYPLGGSRPGVSPVDTGYFVDKSGASFHIALTFGVPAANFAGVLAYLQSLSGPTPSYHFNFHNNVDFAINIGNLSGQPINVADGNFPVGGWAKPAAHLGQVLRYQQFSFTSILTEWGGAETSFGCS